MEKLNLLKQIIINIFILIVLIMIFPFYLLVETLLDIVDFLSMKLDLLALKLENFLYILLPPPGSPSLLELIKKLFK